MVMNSMLVAMCGRMIGSTTIQMRWKRVAPSTLAASITSRGTESSAATNSR